MECVSIAHLLKNSIPANESEALFWFHYSLFQCASLGNFLQADSFPYFLRLKTPMDTTSSSKNNIIN